MIGPRAAGGMIDDIVIHHQVEPEGDAMADAGRRRHDVQPALPGFIEIGAEVKTEDLKILARKRAIALAGAALANKKARPAVAASAVIAGAAYLLRKPIANLVARRLNKGA